MRRLLALVTALMFLELVFFGALSPMLPGLKHEFGFSTSQVGVLVAAYAIGSVLGARPAVMLATRAGVRSAALVSLLAFAATSVAFGVASSFPGLLASRFAQGFTGAACFSAAMIWLLEVAPFERRGMMIGIAFGISEAGSIAAPVLGGAAATIGRAPAFIGAAVVCVGLAVVTTRFTAPPRVAATRLGLRPLLRSSQVRTVMWITVAPAAVQGGVGVLVPLQLHGLGVGVSGITATFGIAAAAGILVRPLMGRWSDRNGPVAAVRLGLAASFPFVLIVPWLHNGFAVAAFVILALVLIGVLWAPVMMMLSDACLAAGVGQAMAVGMLNLAWPPGNAAGAAGAGAIAEVAGQRWAYLAMAAPLLVGLLAISRTGPPASDASPIHRGDDREPRRQRRGAART